MMTITQRNQPLLQTAAEPDPGILSLMDGYRYGFCQTQFSLSYSPMGHSA